MLDLDELKNRLSAEWSNNLDHAVVAAAIRQWRRRLSACEKAGGGHFDSNIVSESVIVLVDF